MAVKHRMDEEARVTMDERARVGNACIDQAAGSGLFVAEDHETHARDAVSDILTALFGPAGYCVYDESRAEVVLDDERNIIARTFLYMALEAWEGDAEDYTATTVTVDNPLLP